MLQVILICAFILVTAADDCIDLCRADTNCNRGSYCKGSGDIAHCQHYFYDSEDKTGGFHYHQSGMLSKVRILCSEARLLISQLNSSKDTETRSRDTALELSIRDISQIPTIVPRSDSTTENSLLVIERRPSLNAQAPLDGRNFRRVTSELSIAAQFELSQVTIEFSYRNVRHVIRDLPYDLEGNFIHLRAGPALAHLISAVEDFGASVLHHRPSSHHVSIHIIQPGNLLNDRLNVIIRLGDFPAMSCSEY